MNWFGDWTEFSMALAAFFVSHALPARPRLRNWLVVRLGVRTYLLSYCIISTLLLGWLIGAAGEAPYFELWPTDDWQTLIPLAAMPLATCLAVFGLTSPNPLSLSMRPPQNFDADRPGIACVVRHPVLWAMLLWSVSHILQNGDLAHVVLFSLFASLSLVGMLAIDRRKRRTLGTAEWQVLARHTSNIPGLALRTGWAPRPSLIDLLKLLVGLVLYCALLATHQVITGVPVVP